MKQASCVATINFKDVFYKVGSFKYFMFYKAFLEA